MAKKNYKVSLWNKNTVKQFKKGNEEICFYNKLRFCRVCRKQTIHRIKEVWNPNVDRVQSTKKCFRCGRYSPDNPTIRKNKNGSYKRRKAIDKKIKGRSKRKIPIEDKIQFSSHNQRYGKKYRFGKTFKQGGKSYCYVYWLG